MHFNAICQDTATILSYSGPCLSSSAPLRVIWHWRTVLTYHQLHWNAIPNTCRHTHTPCNKARSLNVAWGFKPDQTIYSNIMSVWKSEYPPRTSWNAPSLHEYVKEYYIFFYFCNKQFTNISVEFLYKCVFLIAFGYETLSCVCCCTT